MKKIFDLTSTEKEIIISNVAALLKEVPSSLEIIKDDKHKEKRFNYLAKHMVEKAIKRDALIVSDDYNGVAILFEENTTKKESFFSELIADLKLAINVTGIKKGLKALSTQGYVKKQRPKTPHLYCWFWGIMPASRDVDNTKTAYNMKNQFMALSKEKGLPIFAETRIKKVFIAYRWYKFECFHKWDHPSGDVMYFMKYTPPKS